MFEPPRRRTTLFGVPEAAPRPSAHEGLSLLCAPAGIDIALADIITVSPPHDTAGATGSLAARVALEITFLIDGHRRRGG